MERKKFQMQPNLQKDLADKEHMFHTFSQNLTKIPDLAHLKHKLPFVYQNTLQQLIFNDIRVLENDPNLQFRIQNG